MTDQVLILSEPAEAEETVDLCKQNEEHADRSYIAQAELPETVNLPNGLIFTIDRKTGNILDKAGKLLGKIKEQINGDKLLLNNNGEVVRKYRADGSITNADDGMVGNIAIA